MWAKPLIAHNITKETTVNKIMLIHSPSKTVQSWKQLVDHIKALGYKNKHLLYQETLQSRATHSTKPLAS